MNKNLPRQYASWYQFWLDIKDAPFIEQGHERVRIPQGGIATSYEDEEVEWLEYYVQDIKSNALDEVLPFLPKSDNEIVEMVYAQSLTASATDKPKWLDFHNLFF